MDRIDPDVLSVFRGHIQWSCVGCGVLPLLDGYWRSLTLTRYIHDFSRHLLLSALPGARRMRWPGEWMPFRSNFGSCYQLLHHKTGDRNWTNG